MDTLGMSTSGAALLMIIEHSSLFDDWSGPSAGGPAPRVVSALRGQRLAADRHGLGVDEDHREHAGRGAPIDPVVHGAALHEDVARAQVHGRVVHFHVDLTGE